MTANELFSLPPARVDRSLDHLREHFPEIDFYSIEDEECAGIETRIYAEHSSDGDRIWKLAVVAIDSKPFMVIQAAGRSGRDHSARFISSLSLYQEAVTRLLALVRREEGGNSEYISADRDIPDLTSFYGGRTLDEFYDPRLKPLYGEGDILLVRVPENHLGHSRNRVVTRVRVERVNPMNPLDTYRGTQLERSVSMTPGKVSFASTPGMGNLGASFNDRDVVERVSAASTPA